MSSALRFIRLPQVIDRTGLCRSTIYNRIADGKFPAPVPLGGRAVGWVEKDVNTWVKSRIADSQVPPQA